jgi:hypothetical protein
MLRQNINNLTKQEVSVKHFTRDVIKLTEEDRQEIIDILKMLEVFKRKLLKIIT